MAVTTRPKNKDTHPGDLLKDNSSLPDDEHSSERTVAKKVSKVTKLTENERQDVIQRVAEVEQEMDRRRRHELANARKPSGPNVAKKPSATAAQRETNGTYLLDISKRTLQLTGAL